MIITLTNLKGGVGKSTLTALLAKYIARHKPFDPVVVIDMDPQCGSTTILSGKKLDPSQPTIYDALDSEFNGVPSTEIFESSFLKVEGEKKLYLVPSSPRLVQFGSNGASTDLLKYVFESAMNISSDTIILIDTGTMPQLVGMAIAAADFIVIPMTLSKQTIPPTSTTIGMAVKARKLVRGVVPSAVGNAGWESLNIAAYAENIQKTEILKKMGTKVYPALPYSKVMVRGEWVFRNSDVPGSFIPTVDAIYADLFGKSALPPKEEPAQEPQPEAISVVVNQSESLSV